jgi:hypothetical protein
MSDENLKKNQREELLVLLDEMIVSYEKLPQSAMIQPITHYDIESILIWLKAFCSTI